MKTCNFYSNDYTIKSICNILIEALLDAGTNADALQETDLILDRAITKCQAQKAAKMQ